MVLWMVRFVTGDCSHGSLGYQNDEDPGDWGGCPDETLLANPVSVITNEMTFRGGGGCGIVRFGL